ncbi:MAG: hypothetical protein IKY31_01825 [Bacteroidaceae bacterium]|nr:hypothetical protein [Bacteroidaceae bacterium]
MVLFDASKVQRKSEISLLLGEKNDGEGVSLFEFENKVNVQKIGASLTFYTKKHCIFAHQKNTLTNNE